MRRALTLAIVAFVVVLAAGIALLRDEAFLKKHLISYASGDHLTVTVGGVAWSGFGFDITDVVATYGREGGQRFVRVNLGRIAVRPKWTSVLRARVRFARLLVFDPQVTWIDREGGRLPKKISGAFESPPVEVDDFRISHGTFIFVRLSGGTRAVIGVREIAGRVKAFGSSDDRRDDPVEGHLRAQLGFSGETRLSFVVRPAAARTTADIDVRIENQNLKDLGHFFEPNAGLTMTGLMKLGHARSKMRGASLTTTLRAVFENLELEVAKTRDRSTWEAIATNLGISLGLRRGNSEATRGDQTRTVTTSRAPDDSLVSFYLRGLKDAATSVAKKPAARALTE